MKNVGIIGLGNLGSCLTSLFYRNKICNFLSVADKNRAKLEGIQMAQTYECSTDLIKNSDIIFLTVKPNSVKEVCREISELTDISQRKMVVSAAAGVTINHISKWLQPNLNYYNVVRCMPNIPIEYGKGAIVWHGDLPGEEKNLLESITRGPKNIWVDREDKIDVATAISGAGPAYIAEIYQTYFDLGIDMGLSGREITDMLVSLFEGTPSSILYSCPERVIKKVASKGGATEIGLQVLADHYFSDIIRNSIYHSMDRIEKIKEKLD